MGALKANSSGKLCSCSSKKLRACDESWCPCTDDGLTFDVEFTLNAACVDGCETAIPIAATLIKEGACTWEWRDGNSYIMLTYLSLSEQWELGVGCFKGFMAAVFEAEMSKDDFDCAGVNTFVSLKVTPSDTVCVGQVGVVTANV